MRGLFVSLEGPEGAGKSTQIKMLSDFFNKNRIPCTVVREPGGTPVGDAVRSILLNPQYQEMEATTEMLLYAASRSQLVREVILPALKRGEIVLCDRYVDSSIAYQGYGAQNEIETVIAINQIATGGLLPDRTYLLDLTVEEGQKRLIARGTKKDRMEQKSSQFHDRVRMGYLMIAKRDPRRFKVINATYSPEKVFDQILYDLLELWEMKQTGKVQIVDPIVE